MSQSGFLIFLFGIAAGAILAYIIKGRMISQKVKTAEQDAIRLLEDTKLKADAVLKDAKIEARDKLLKMKTEFETETQDTRAELKNLEKRLNQKEESLSQKTDQLSIHPVHT